MHNLVPSLILERYAAGEFHGNFPAVGMFVDISGFSAMTDALMVHGQEGAEVLANIMRSVLDPMMESVFAQGGFVANSAGDAITVLFPITESAESASLRALAAAWNIQKYLLTHAEYPSAHQTFQVSAKVGLALGAVHWGILQSANGRSGVYYFQGSAVDGSAEAEHQAKAGEIILQGGFFRQVEPLAQAETVGEYYRLRQVDTAALPQAQTAPEFHSDPEILAHFYPKSIIAQGLSGEFRQVVNMFINLPSVRTETQLEIFIESVFLLKEKYGGFLSRLDFGDKGTNLLLFWGAPTAFENDIDRALNFILDLQMVTSIPISAGLTYRISHAGFIGGRLYLEYTCFGRGVNLAARFMTAAPRGEIWVDEYIAGRAAQRYEIEFVEERRFKGFQQSQKVFVLLERKEAAAPLFIGALAGREVELERLDQFIQPIFQGGCPGMLVVTGEAGIGKSRLVHDFLVGLESAGQTFQTFLGQTDEILRQSLSPFKYWLRQYFGVVEVQGESRSKRNFNRKLDMLITAVADQQLADELDRTRSFLGALVGLHWPDSLYEQLDAPGRYKNTFIALTSLLQAESSQTPVILLLEDIQWLDADSGAFLNQLGRILTVQKNLVYPLAILATSRSGSQNPALAGLNFSDMALGGLHRKHLNTLVEELMQSPPGEDLLNLLEQRAEGNPFYAEQILRYLKDGDLLALDHGVWQIRPGQVDTLPIDVNALLVARLDHLTQQVKNAVQTAAVLGREFEVNLLSYMLRKEGANPLPEIILAEQEAVWTSLTELRYIFIHALLRDAAYQMQVHTRRKAQHSLALEAYEKLSGVGLKEHYGELAYHAEQAGLGEQARHYLELAGSAALEAYQNDLAVDCFTRALALTSPDDASRRYDLLMKREQVYLYLAKNAERERDLAELAASLPELGDDRKAVDVMLRQSRLDLDLGRYAQAEEYANRAADLALSVENLEKATVAFRYLATSSRRQAKLEQAADLARQSVSLASKCSSQEEEGKAINMLGLIAIEQGKLEEAREAFKHGLEITHQTGDFRFLGSPLNNLGLVATQQWNYTEAQNYFQQALQVAQKIGDRLGEAVALGNLGFITGSLGDYPQARLITERYLRICREVGNPYHESNALVNLSAWAIALQDFESAGQSLRQALQMSQSIGSRSEESWALTYLGHSQLAQGELDAARQAYTEALSIRQELAQPELACELVAGLARVALLRGDLPVARQHIDAILTHLERGGSLQGADQPLRVDLTCYQVLQQAGDPRAGRLLETAYGILQERAAKIADEPARQIFLNNIEYHREIKAAYQDAAEN